MTYQELISRPGVTLVEFYASWCPHCRRMMPIVEEVKELVGSTAEVYQFDIDQYPSIAEEAGAESVPTFILYRSGEEVWRHVGEIAGDDLVSAISSAR